MASSEMISGIDDRLFTSIPENYGRRTLSLFLLGRVSIYYTHT